MVLGKCTLEPDLPAIYIKRLCVGVLLHSLPHLGELWRWGGGTERLSLVMLEQNKVLTSFLSQGCTHRSHIYPGNKEKADLTALIAEKNTCL